VKALVLDIQPEEWELTKGMSFIEVPEPKLEESKNTADGSKVIVKPLYTGFCGSDKGVWFRHAFKDLIFDSLEQSENEFGRICGHELLGEIVEVGSYVSKVYGYRAGDLVSTESHIFCGQCHQCKIGDAHVCSNHLIIGISTDGCFADYVKLPAKELWRTNLDEIRPEVAAIQEPLGNAVHACSRVDLRGRTLAVFGCGTIGLFTILMARAMGATTIIGVDPNEKNLKLAGELGADEVLCVPGGSVHGVEHAPDLEVVEAIRKRCFGEGVDVAFEMSGSNQALNTAIASTRAGGDIILFGLSAGDYTITNFQEIILYGKSMHSVVGRKVFQTWYTMRNLLTSKEHNLQDRIYDVILNKGDGTVMPFHQFDQGVFEQAIQEHPKIVLKYR
jgi:threonine 3-dehydrogenase